jgi:23S rRNA G2445 N2-methylase RlmL
MTGRGKRDKELYAQLRLLSPAQLWEEEVPHFDHASGEDRRQRVALIRAAGVVFSESGTATEKQRLKVWLHSLLRDPEEKIRRYAILALPKLGADADDENELLARFRQTQSSSERIALAGALEKIGGRATLEQLPADALDAPDAAAMKQKVKASVARELTPSSLRIQSPLSHFHGLRIHLRTRSGLEQILRDEVEHEARRTGKWRLHEVRRGLVSIRSRAPFTLADLYQMRCFATVGFELGTVSGAGESGWVEEIAELITSLHAKALFDTFTEGSTRYRLEFASRGHQRATVRAVAAHAYGRCPEILNDPRRAPWVVSVQESSRATLVELQPKLTPDPRFPYRVATLPAASYPPLAAGMARLAGCTEREIVWDPFCGSGLELIERARLGGVAKVFGTDSSASAVAMAQSNFGAAKLQLATQFTCGDFHNFAAVPGLGANAVTLIITNPPMGKRVPVANLEALIRDLFSVAAVVLQAGGRLVFANPVRLESPERSLRLEYRQVAEFGGFHCRLEKYVKVR